MTQPDPPVDALPVDDLRDVPPTVLAMADHAVLRMHVLLDGAPLALVVNAYRAGHAHGRMEAAAAIRAAVDPSKMRKITCEVMEAAAKVADLPAAEVKP